MQKAENRWRGDRCGPTGSWPGEGAEAGGAGVPQGSGKPRGTQRQGLRPGLLTHPFLCDTGLHFLICILSCL